MKLLERLCELFRREDMEYLDDEDYENGPVVNYLRPGERIEYGDTIPTDAAAPERDAGRK